MFYVLARWSIEHQRWRAASFADDVRTLHGISEPGDLVLKVSSAATGMAAVLAGLPAGPGRDAQDVPF